jgi:diaminopimelate decarboxylase/aspartate kinase
VILKFGGTSVSGLESWTNVARVAAERCSGGARVLIVHSALAGITDRLERLLDAAIGQAAEAELRAIEERHRRLAAELGIPLPAAIEEQLRELREMAAGVALVREVSERTRARVMAAGE